MDRNNIRSVHGRMSQLGYMKCAITISKIFSSGQFKRHSGLPVYNAIEIAKLE